MAPEQARGMSDVDARADIWSLGIVLCQCLTGVLPFKASTPTDMLLAILTTSATPVSALAPNVPSAIAATVDRALRRDREERYASVAALAHALEVAAREQDLIETPRASPVESMPTIPSTRVETLRADHVLEGETRPTVRDAVEPSQEASGDPLGSTPLGSTTLGGATLERAARPRRSRWGIVAAAVVSLAILAVGGAALLPRSPAGRGSRSVREAGPGHAVATPVTQPQPTSPATATAVRESDSGAVPPVARETPRATVAERPRSRPRRAAAGISAARDAGLRRGTAGVVIIPAP